MSIGYSERQTIENSLRGKNDVCPMCSTNNWEFVDDFVIAPCFDLEYKRVIEGRVLLMVALICNECGYVRQISAAQLGLIK